MQDHDFTPPTAPAQPTPTPSISQQPAPHHTVLFLRLYRRSALGCALFRRRTRSLPNPDGLGCSAALAHGGGGEYDVDARQIS